MLSFAALWLLNVAWNPVFFVWHQLAAALVILVLLLLGVVAFACETIVRLTLFRALARFADPALLRAKLMEEAGELMAAADPQSVAAEAADLLYFTLVAAAAGGANDAVVRGVYG